MCDLPFNMPNLAIVALLFEGDNYLKNYYLLLCFIGGILVHPTQFGIAVLAHDIPDHVSSCQHYALLNIAKS